MKKIIMIMCIIYYANSVHAQNIQNGDFSVNSGNDLPGFCGIFGTFSDGSVTNWIRTHGTPHIPPGTNNIGLFTNSGTEGIVGGYDFQVGKRYCITIELSTWVFDDQEFEVWATNNISRNLAVNGQCTSPAPTPPPGSELIAVCKTGKKFFSLGYEPSTPQTQLFIFSKGMNDHMIVINEVSIGSTCANQLIFYNGIFPANTYEALITYLGTTAGPAGPYQTVQNVDNSVTEMRSRHINLWENTLITAAADGYFLAEAVDADEICPPLDCTAGGFTPMRNSDNDGENLSDEVMYANELQAAVDNGDAQAYQELSQAHTAKSNAGNSGLTQFSESGYYRPKVYPNPNHGTFTIRFPRKGNYEIQVFNMLGAVVYKQVLDDQEVAELNLQSNPPGNYTLHIKGAHLQHVEKVTIL